MAKKILINVSRIFLGFVFIMSGFVKIIDPLGTSYKFGDYFIAFKVEMLVPSALFLSFVMCAAEFIIGLMLLLNTKLKLGGWGAFALMAIFTPVTLYIAVTNTVSDCGCFGDFLVLDNWQTFYKNIIIDAVIVVLLLTMNAQKAYFNKKTEWILIGLFSISTFAFELYNYRHLPIIDFRPYSIGSNISEKMTLPEGAATDVYEIQFIYEKDGVKKTFSQENYPWKDSTWTYVDRIDKLISKGDEPEIHDFSITTTEHDQLPDTPTNQDITEYILTDDNYCFLLISSKVEKVNIEGLKSADLLAKQCEEKGLKFYTLTSSSTSEINYIKNTTGIELMFYTTDETTLKTIVRSNPGLVLLKEGIVIDKWHFTDIPSMDELETKYLSNNKEEK